MWDCDNSRWGQNELTELERTVGRRPKLTIEVSAAIVQIIRRGAFDYVAAQTAGISPSTFYDWLAKGRAGIEPYAEFSEKVA